MLKEISISSLVSFELVEEFVLLTAPRHYFRAVYPLDQYVNDRSIDYTPHGHCELATRSFWVVSSEIVVDGSSGPSSLCCLGAKG